MSDLSDVRCPKCRGNLVFLALENRVIVDEVTDKSASSLFREVWCQECDYHCEYVPWHESSQGNASTLSSTPLTSPPSRSNAALILDSYRTLLASEPSLGVAVQRAQSFEHAEYIVWCVGSVLKRVRTAQRDEFGYHHVWDGAKWEEFFVVSETHGTQPTNQ